MLGDVRIEHRTNPLGQTTTIAFVTVNCVDADYGETGSPLFDYLWLKRRCGEWNGSAFIFDVTPLDFYRCAFPASKEWFVENGELRTFDQAYAMDYGFWFRSHKPGETFESIGWPKDELGDFADLLVGVSE